MPRSADGHRPVRRTTRPPRASRDWAWFFDIDGTLVELAPTPSSITPHDDLPDLIGRLRDASHGAVSLITGRAVSDVDEFLPVPGVTVAGQHGFELRTAAGKTQQRDVEADFETIRKELSQIIAKHRGLLAEYKGASVALHYRRAPALASYASRVMRSLKERHGHGLVIQRGKRVVELRPSGVDKGRAISHLMMMAPFKGRVPVFVGDDVTDEAGFDIVNTMGGHSVKVGRGRTRARWRLGSVDDVREWLTQAIEDLNGTE